MPKGQKFTDEEIKKAQQKLLAKAKKPASRGDLVEAVGSVRLTKRAMDNLLAARKLKVEGGGASTRYVAAA